MKSVNVSRVIAMFFFAFVLLTAVTYGIRMGVESNAVALFNVIGGGFVMGLAAMPIVRMLIHRMTPEEALEGAKRRFFPNKAENEWKELLMRELKGKAFDLGYVLKISTMGDFREHLTTRKDYFAAMMGANIYQILERLREIEETQDPVRKAELLDSARGDISFILPLILEHVRQHGIVVRSELVSSKPLAMGNYYFNTTTSLTREHWPKPPETKGQ
jgi:hypothetical protein